MTFEKITNDTTCDCLNGIDQDTVSIFARALNKGAVAEKDFISKWDKTHRAEDCKNICGLKGISISKIENDTIKEEYVAIYSKIFKMAPNYRKSVLLFNFKEDAGLVQPTPNEKDKNHHDFYKADDFTLNYINQTGILFLSAPTSV